MSEYDIVCVNCLHRSHLGKPCPYCPSPTKDNPDSKCTTFVRADVFIAHTIARIEQAQHNSHGQLMAGLSTIFDLFCEVYPEASDRLQQKLKERQESAQAEIEKAQQKAKEEAEVAFQEAHEAEVVRAEERMKDELVEKYTSPGYDSKVDSPPSNVVSFPARPIPDKAPNSDDDEAV